MNTQNLEIGKVEQKEFFGRKVFIFEDDDVIFEQCSRLLFRIGVKVLRGGTCLEVDESLKSNPNLFKGVDAFIFDFSDGTGDNFARFLPEVRKQCGESGRVVANSGSNNDDYVKLGIDKSLTVEKKNAKEVVEKVIEILRK